MIASQHMHADIDALVDVTKSTFVEMYNHEDYFDKIREELTNNTDDEDKPNLGTLNIQEIYESDYFFV